MRSNLNTFNCLKITILRTSRGSHSANVSAKFNSGLLAVDKKGRVKKSQKQKKKLKTQADKFGCSQDLLTCLDGIFQGHAHEQTTICRQLFGGHLVGSRPMRKKKNLQRMIINNYWMRIL